MQHLELLEQAREDLREAMLWYESKQEKLGIRLLKEVRKTLQSVVNNPKQFRKVKKSYRQVLVDTFPYIIIYEIIKEKIVVYRIFHTSRNPKLRSRK
jgi:plasmid stabilization system protein ParE